MEEGTAQGCIDDLHELLNKVVTSEMGFDDPSGIYKIHAYGKGNVEEYKYKFTENIQKLRLVVEQYHKWNQTEKEASVRKYLTNTRDQLQQDSQLNSLKESLESCFRMSHKYLQQSEALKDLGGTLNSQTTLLRLQEMGDQLKLDTDVLDSMDEDPSVSKTVVLSSEGLLLDVELSQDGDVKGVKMEITGEEPNEQFNVELTESIRRSWEEFREKISRIVEKDRLCRIFSLYEPKISLSTLFSDCFTIHKAEASSFDEMTLLKERHGIFRQCCEGLRVFYWLSPLNTLEFTGEHRGDYLQAAESVLIGLEQASYDRAVSLSRTSVVTVLDNGEFDFAPPSMDANTVPLHYVLHFDRPLIAPLSTMRKANSLVYGPSGSPFMSKHPEAKSVQQILSQQETPSKIESLVAIGGQTHRYVHCGAQVSAIEVRRVPFTHISQLMPLLQIFRQQLMFNELLSSCYQPHEDLPENAQAGQTFEISSYPPQSITITSLHPKTQHFLSIEVSIGPNGTIQSHVNYYPGDPPLCSTDQISKFIRTSGSLPIALAHILSKFG